MSHGSIKSTVAYLLAPISHRDVSPRAARRWLIVITLCALALRFFRLSFPPPLTDEAFTFWRTSGSLGQMLDTLRFDGFMPLHYEIVWLFTRAFGHEVWVLRLPAAIAGVLMPLAVYSLGRVMFSRRVGVVAALIAMSSAFLSYHQRDAKMYAPAWLAMTVSMACMLRFARTRRSIHALLSIFCGVFTAGVYAPAAGILLAGPFVSSFWARQSRWRVFAALLLACVIIAASPVIYYKWINHWFDVAGGISNAVDGQQAKHDNGLMWVESWQRGRTAGNTLLSCLSSYLIGYEWPVRSTNLDSETAFNEKQAYAIASATRIALAVALAISAIATAFSRASTRKRLPRLLAFTFLVCIPLYLFYLRSFTALLPPWRINPWDIVGTACGVVVMILIFGSLFARRGRAKVSHRLVFAAVAIFACLGVMSVVWFAVRWEFDHHARLANGTLRWNALWMPRYSGMVAPFLIVFTAAMFLNIPIRALRMMAILAFVTLNLAASIARYETNTEIPYGPLTRDMAATIEDGDRVVSMSWVPNRFGLWFPPLPSPYYQLVQSAGIDVDPPGFRDGVTWPYRLGPAVRRLQREIAIYPFAELANIQKRRPGTKIVDVWRRDDAIGKPEPVIPGFSVTSREEFVVRHIWTWALITRMQRLEYESR